MIRIVDSTSEPLSVTEGQTINAFAAVKVLDDFPLGNTETVNIHLAAPQYSYPPVTDVGTITDPQGGGTTAFDHLFIESGLNTGTPSFLSNLLGRVNYNAPILPNGQSAVVLATVSVGDGRGGGAVDTPIVIGVESAPLITGTTSNEPVAAGNSIAPFAVTNITDNDFGYYYLNGQYVGGTGPTDVANITILDGGKATDADGLLTGPGLSKTGTGTYSLAGSPSTYSFSSELQNLKFATTSVAPGQTINPTFKLDVTDTKANLTSTDAATSLLIVGPIPVPVAPTIHHTLAGQTVTPGNVIDPFASVHINDNNLNPSDTVTITLKDSAGNVSDANGTLTGTGLSETAPGVYVLAANSAAIITSEIDALTFHPTGLPKGVSSATTGFAISVTDIAVGLSASDNVTTVVENAIPKIPEPTKQYVVADHAGTPLLQDVATGKSQNVSGNQISFKDGTGIFDPTGTAENVARLYQAALGRAPDVGGLMAWTSQIDSSVVPLSAVANVFASSPEFIQDYGALSDADYVDRLYENVLGRPGDAGGIQAWEHQLASGASRGSVLLGFAESQENKAHTISTAGDVNNAEAYRLYQAALNRIPDAAGQDYWANQLSNGATPVQLAQGFIGSAEFQQKYGSLSISDFVSTLYQNVLHRSPDGAGQQYWSNMLQQGTGEANVLVGFSDSLENRLQTAGATHANWIFIPT